MKYIRMSLFFLGVLSLASIFVGYMSEPLEKISIEKSISFIESRFISQDNMSKDEFDAYQFHKNRILLNHKNQRQASEDRLFYPQWLIF